MTKYKHGGAFKKRSEERATYEDYKNRQKYAQQHGPSTDTQERRAINVEMMKMIAAQNTRQEIIDSLSQTYPHRITYILQMLNQRAVKIPYLQEVKPEEETKDKDFGEEMEL